MSASYSFSKIINPAKIMWEIHDSNITVCIIDAVVEGSISTLNFKASLTTAEQDELASIVDAHDPTPILGDQMTTATIMEAPDYSIPLIDKTYREKTWGLDSGTILQPDPIVVTFPYPIVLLGGDLPVRTDMVGDIAKVTLHPFHATGDICGAITENCVASNGYIEVSGTMASEYLFKAFRVFLTDGATFFDDLGEVCKKSGNKLYFESIPEDRPAGTYVKAYYDIIPQYELNTSPYRAIIGENTMRGTFVEKGWALKLSYINTTLTNKRVVFSLEYYI